MSANLLARLRRLIPSAPVIVCKVLVIHDDDTSTVQLPQAQSISYGAGLLAGSTLRVRGVGVPVGANAFVRAGVIESRAPDAEATDIVLGSVIDRPQGPPRLAAAATAPTLPLGIVGAPYSVNLSTLVVGGYLPYALSLTVGALPPGLALSGAVLSGTPSATGASSFTLQAVDSTRRAVVCPALLLTIT